MQTFDPEAQRKALNRLRRARGQLDAVIAAVENQKTCREIVTQLAAVSGALDRAGFTIISTAMRDCLADDVQDEPVVQSESQQEAGQKAGQESVQGSGQESGKVTMEELEKLFMMLS